MTYDTIPGEDQTKRPERGENAMREKKQISKDGVPVFEVQYERVEHGDGQYDSTDNGEDVNFDFSLEGHINGSNTMSSDHSYAVIRDKCDMTVEFSTDSESLRASKNDNAKQVQDLELGSGRTDVDGVNGGENPQKKRAHDSGYENILSLEVKIRNSIYIYSINFVEFMNSFIHACMHGTGTLIDNYRDNYFYSNYFRVATRSMNPVDHNTLLCRV